MPESPYKPEFFHRQDESPDDRQVYDRLPFSDVTRERGLAFADVLADNEPGQPIRSQ